MSKFIRVFWDQENMQMKNASTGEVLFVLVESPKTLYRAWLIDGPEHTRLLFEGEDLEKVKAEALGNLEGAWNCQFILDPRSPLERCIERVYVNPNSLLDLLALSEEAPKTEEMQRISKELEQAKFRYDVLKKGLDSIKEDLKPAEHKEEKVSPPVRLEPTVSYSLGRFILSKVESFHSFCDATGLSLYNCEKLFRDELLIDAELAEKLSEHIGYSPEFWIEHSNRIRQDQEEVADKTHHLYDQLHWLATIRFLHEGNYAAALKTVEDLTMNQMESLLNEMDSLDGGMFRDLVSQDIHPAYVSQTEMFEVCKRNEDINSVKDIKDSWNRWI